MAYLDMSEAGRRAPADIGAMRTPQADVVPARGLSALEWQVVALAERDSPRSLYEPSRLAVALGGLFGSGRPARLADPRLEALRRMAVLAWRRGYAVAASEIAAFHDAGFSEHQLELLVSSIERRRLPRSRERLA